MNYQFHLSRRWMRGATLLSLAALMSLGIIACGSKTETSEGEATTQVEETEASAVAPAGSEQFIGMWEPQVPPEELSPGLFFTEDGRAFFISPNPDENQAVEMEYALNSEASPMQLDIILPGQADTLKGIVELTGDDAMRLDGAEELSDPRPTDFTDEAVEFKRISKEGVLPEGMNVLTKERIKEIQTERAVPPSQ